jgi:hypothetical protein
MTFLSPRRLGPRYDQTAVVPSLGEQAMLESSDQDADGNMDHPSGEKVAWFADPDGNTCP